MPDHMIQLSEQEAQRIEAILLDRDKEGALQVLKEVIKEKLRSTTSHACGPKPV